MEESEGGLDLTRTGYKEVRGRVKVETEIDIEARRYKCMSLDCDDVATVQYHVQIEDPTGTHNLFLAFDLCQVHEFDLSLVLVPYGPLAEPTP